MKEFSTDLGPPLTLGPQDKLPQLSPLSAALVIPSAVIILDWLREEKEKENQKTDDLPILATCLSGRKGRACNCQKFETGRTCSQNRRNLPTSLQIHDLRLHHTVVTLKM